MLEFSICAHVYIQTNAPLVSPETAMPGRQKSHVNRRVQWAHISSTLRQGPDIFNFNCVVPVTTSQASEQ